MSTAQMEKVLAAWPQVEPALRVPRTEREYRQMVKLLDRLIDAVGENENHHLASLMEVLGVLIEKYEDDNVPELKALIHGGPGSSIKLAKASTGFEFKHPVWKKSAKHSNPKKSTVLA